LLFAEEVMWMSVCDGRVSATSKLRTSFVWSVSFYLSDKVSPTSSKATAIIALSLTGTRSSLYHVKMASLGGRQRKCWKEDFEVDTCSKLPKSGRGGEDKKITMWK
jgi:hypothetical protein